MISHEVFIQIHQGCFAGTGAIVRLPQCQWSKPDGYGKISQCITTTKHSKAKTVCIFLGIYCIYKYMLFFSHLFCLSQTAVLYTMTHDNWWCYNEFGLKLPEPKIFHTSQPKPNGRNFSENIFNEGAHWQTVITGSDKGLGLSANKLLHEPMLNNNYVTIWPHQAISKSVKISSCTDWSFCIVAEEKRFPCVKSTLVGD